MTNIDLAEIKALNAEISRQNEAHAAALRRFYAAEQEAERALETAEYERREAHAFNVATLEWWMRYDS